MIAAAEGNTLIINGLKAKQFDSPISKLLIFKPVVVVLLDVYGTQNNENVYGMAEDGEMLWRIPVYKYTYIDSPFMEIHTDGEYVKIINWEGSYTVIDPHTGATIISIDDSRSDKRLW